MTDNILILCNGRSLNKTRVHIKSLKELKFKPVIITDIDADSLKESPFFFPDVEYRLLEIESSEKLMTVSKELDPRFICTVSENLWEVVVALEEFCGLPLSVSKEGARLLANKFLLDQFCYAQGLPVARSLIPSSHRDFEQFEKNCLLKPTVGSGQYYNFRDEENDEYFEYRFFENGKSLKRYLEKINKLDTVITANTQKNYRPLRYSKMPVQFMLQEYFEPIEEYSCLGNIINGEVSVNSTGRLYKSANAGDKNSTLAELDKLGRIQHCTEHQLYVMGPPEKSALFKDFLESLVRLLKIRHLQFSGPDYFKLSDSSHIFSDFNARISGQLNETPDSIACEISKQFWEGVLLKKSVQKPKEFDKFYGTGFPYLQAGRYQYIHKKNQLRFSNEDFTVQFSRKSMDNKINATKMVLSASSLEEVADLFDHVYLSLKMKQV